MKRFENILVGVDLADCDRLVADKIGDPSQSAVDRSIWLAKHSGASLTFVYALDVSGATQRLIDEHDGDEPNVFDAANKSLSQIVQQAEAEGISASAKVVLGRSWYKLIREVLKKHHDLVLVGTRDAGPLDRVVIGSTAMKLLRKCPCPVWVTKPGAESIGSVLVAHDLTPVGQLALELGASMADLNEARLHVLHSLEHPELEKVFPGRVEQGESAARTKAALGQIEAELKRIAPNQSGNVYLKDDRPEYAISDAIREHHVDLVVMGTIARTGIRGYITGNTAERLLPLLPCSVLAVKPDDFECPIEID